MCCIGLPLPFIKSKGQYALLKVMSCFQILWNRFVYSPSPSPSNSWSSFFLTSGRETSDPVKSENIRLAVELRMPNFQMKDQRTPWNFTSGHLNCLSNQSKSILFRNFQESLVSSSLRRIRDWFPLRSPPSGVKYLRLAQFFPRALRHRGSKILRCNFETSVPVFFFGRSVRSHQLCCSSAVPC